MERNTQKAIPPQFQVVKVFPQRGDLCLHRLVKPAAFTYNRCSLGKTSTLVAFAKDKWDEPVCNGCYGYLLAASEINDCAKGTQDNPVGVTALHSDHSRPAGLENLHVGIGSLIRVMEPNKEERKHSVE